uniref:Uncharacterized protein n=1 Tax=Setaria viridis TaxID=4556 RepID=A0A4V6D8W1_SETVI|nr:hypothetical protein SEVIR_4G281900v2 [Setaria viridis]
MADLEKNGRRPLQTDGFFTERSNSRVTTSGICEPEIFTMTASAKCSMLAATEVNPLPQILGGKVPVKGMMEGFRRWKALCRK